MVDPGRMLPLVIDASELEVDDSAAVAAGRASEAKQGRSTLAASFPSATRSSKLYVAVHRMDEGTMLTPVEDEDGGADVIAKTMSLSSGAAVEDSALAIAVARAEPEGRGKAAGQTGRGRGDVCERRCLAAGLTTPTTVAGTGLAVVLLTCGRPEPGSAAVRTRIGRESDRLPISAHRTGEDGVHAGHAAGTT